MNNITIKKVAVIGSGIMGSRIACHFANIGVKVLLLDICPKELSEEEKRKGLSLKDKIVRNRIVNNSFLNTLKTKPKSFYVDENKKNISLGNIQDDMNKIREADWIIEVVVEKLEIKKTIFKKIEKSRKKGTLITSNTSGIPVKQMIEGRSLDFVENFCVTHFFNPPRYMKLLEIVPGEKTKKEITDFLMYYGSLFLGKETVLCKDTPAFIANRVGIYSIMSAMHTIDEMGLSVGEVDFLTGPKIGRAKSATFRTMDVVGLDTTVNVSNNISKDLPKDESKGKFKLPESVKELYKRKWWGDKTKQGYYKKTINEKGKKEILELNLKTYEYGPRTKAKFNAFNEAKNAKNLKERLKILVNYDDKAGEFYRKTFYDSFRYCSFRIPEITDDLYKIDQAIKAGFAWKTGPFETWDMLGVEETVKKMKKNNLAPADWVEEMLKNNIKSFYKYEKGKKLYYDIPTKKYKKIPGSEGLIILDAFKEKNVVWKNTGTTLYDVGNGVLNLEFHTKMNTMGAEVVEGINKSITIAEKNFKGIVIGNEGENFSAGANLGMLFMLAGNREFQEINLMIAAFQNTIMRVRFSSVPVVVATSGLTLGGGCEISMHADVVRAHTETYMGLVEAGVGIIPSGAGTKEMTLRTSDMYRKGDPELNILMENFMTIATAKVATSSKEAVSMNLLRNTDKHTLSRSKLLSDAKKDVINLFEAGYTQKKEREDIKVQGKSGIAMFEAGVASMFFGNYISEHDKKIAQKTAYVMCGGDLSQPSFVSERYLLELEREAVVSLCGEPKTLERMHGILFKRKTIRN